MSGETTAARWAEATSPDVPKSARHTESSARWPVTPDEALVPQTNDVSNSSRVARTMIDAATDMAVSKSCPSAHTAGVSSTTSVTWLRRVSRYCRTSSRVSSATAIALADDRQCTCRRSSPGTYSRSAWNARSLCDTASVETPSRSRSRPAPSESIGTIGGRTRISTTSVHSTSRESIASGSPRRVVAGPTGITPRRSVRMVKLSSWVSSGPSRGTA